MVNECESVTKISQGSCFMGVTNGKEAAYIEDVLVVGNCQNELNYQFAAPGNNGTPGAPVCVLPAYSVVLLVKTDCVWHFLSLTIWSVDDSIKILHTLLAICTRLLIGTPRMSGLISLP